MTFRYFAWVREKIGRSEERVSVPNSVKTVADLVAWMQTRGDGYADAFAKPAVIRTAIDHRHVQTTALIDGAREIGFFPPVTGG
ncbi:MAG TPA: molybdopterin converting factor subunit 1 [Hyphomicrobium sp.]|nr:molybdopterin converting factor subunit 1 [Hyphomicrobium sp.]